jgi:hypothetical protein
VISHQAISWFQKFAFRIELAPLHCGRSGKPAGVAAYGPGPVTDDLAALLTAESPRPPPRGGVDDDGGACNNNDDKNNGGAVRRSRALSRPVLHTASNTVTSRIQLTRSA